MNPTKYIERYLKDNSELEKVDISRARLAADYAKISFENRKFWLSFFGVLITAFGLLFGFYQFLDNRKAQILTQRSQFESQIALRFFSLKYEEKFPYIENLEAFGDFDHLFIQKLRNGLVDLPIPQKPAPVAGGAPNANIDDISRSNDIADLLPELISTISKKRRAARKTVSNILNTCVSEECLKFVDTALVTDNLTTSERYRLALGLTVALSLQDEKYLKLAMSRYPSSEVLIEKLRKLSNIKEPAISSAAKATLDKIKTNN